MKPKLSGTNSIFRPSKDKEERASRFNFIHYTMKARLLVPLMKIADRFGKKFIIQDKKDIPDYVNNKNFAILYDTLDETYKDWWFKWKGINRLEARKNKNKHQKAVLKDMKREWRIRKKAHWYSIPNLLIRFIITVCLEDTAYREMANMYMFRLQGNMNKAYKPEIVHKFPLYVDSYDNSIPYFIEWAKKAGGGKMTIQIDANKESVSTQFMPALLELIKSAGGSVVVSTKDTKLNKKDAVV